MCVCGHVCASLFSWLVFPIPGWHLWLGDLVGAQSGGYIIAMAMTPANVETLNESTNISGRVLYCRM